MASRTPAHELDFVPTATRHGSNSSGSPPVSGCYRIELVDSARQLADVQTLVLEWSMSLLPAPSKHREVTDPITICCGAEQSPYARILVHRPAAGTFPLAGICQRSQPCAAMPSPDGLRLSMSRVISFNVRRCPRLQRLHARACMYLCRLQSITVFASTSP
jgi:hypothetical protein